MSNDGDSKPPFLKFWDAYFSIVDGPVTAFREKIVEPIKKKNKTVYYHRRFRRVPTIDECDIGDQVCIYEANEQFKRDKGVDSEVLNILRNRRVQCEFFYGSDAEKRCAKTKEDYEEAAGNWFMKYGDLGAAGNVLEAYMKQKHRMIWERRHGPVGSGMKQKSAH